MIRFAVPGRPMGYVRTTQRQKWVDPRWKRYQAFKNAVAACSWQVGPWDAIIDAIRNGKVYLEITIYYKSNARRPDPTNVLNGVIDALFRQDRNVVGRVKDFHFDKENPRVEVTIWEGGENVTCEG